MPVFVLRRMSDHEHLGGGWTCAMQDVENGMTANQANPGLGMSYCVSGLGSFQTEINPVDSHLTKRC